MLAFTRSVYKTKKSDKTRKAELKSNIFPFDFFTIFSFQLQIIFCYSRMTGKFNDETTILLLKYWRLFFSLLLCSEYYRLNGVLLIQLISKSDRLTKNLSNTHSRSRKTIVCTTAHVLAALFACKPLRHSACDCV